MPSRNVRHRHVAVSQRLNPHRLLLTTLLLPLVLADDPTSTPAQFSSPFTDQLTGLPMERFFGARTSFAFAFALPPAPPPPGTSGSFIGQLSFPLANGIGWGAMGLTGSMDGNFILAAWPDGAGGVMASFRQATDEDNPPEVTGNFAVRPLPGGTSVNETQLTFTFLCENCLDATLGLGPEKMGGDAVMGWALSERAPRGDARDPGAQLGFHERGFGPFTARLGSAATEGFEAVAATALGAVPASARAGAAVPGAFEEESGDEADSDDDDSDSDDDDGDDDDDNDDDD